MRSGFTQSAAKRAPPAGTWGEISAVGAGLGGAMQGSLCSELHLPWRASSASGIREKPGGDQMPVPSFWELMNLLSGCSTGKRRKVKPKEEPPPPPNRCGFW